ncbi:Protein of unknown function [Gryllus bimaculatus]|nr:Protein of unknown function [Gryllus bimaculatus]
MWEQDAVCGLQVRWRDAGGARQRAGAAAAGRVGAPGGCCRRPRPPRSCPPLPPRRCARPAYAHRLFVRTAAPAALPTHAHRQQNIHRAAEGGAVHRAATLALAELVPAARRARGTAASYLLAAYVPHLHRQLRLAAERRDAVAVQLYVRALGTAATPLALAAFQPYLEVRGFRCGSLPLRPGAPRHRQTEQTNHFNSQQTHDKSDSSCFERRSLWENLVITSNSQSCIREDSVPIRYAFASTRNCANHPEQNRQLQQPNRTEPNDRRSQFDCVRQNNSLRVRTSEGCDQQRTFVNCEQRLTMHTGFITRRRLAARGRCGPLAAAVALRKYGARCLAPGGARGPRLVRRLPHRLAAAERARARGGCGAAAAGGRGVPPRPPAARAAPPRHPRAQSPAWRVVAPCGTPCTPPRASPRPARAAHLAANAQAALPFLEPSPLSAHYSRSYAATERSAGGGALRAEVDVLNGADSTVPDAVFADIFKSTDDATLEALVQAQWKIVVPAATALYLTVQYFITYGRGASILFTSSDFFYEQIMQEVLNMDNKKEGNAPEHTEESKPKGKTKSARNANGEEEANGCDPDVEGEECEKRREDIGFAEDFKKHPDLGVFKSICGNRNISLSECGLRSLEYLIQSRQRRRNEEGDEGYVSDVGQPDGTQEPRAEGNGSQATESRARAHGPKATEGRPRNWHNLCDYDNTDGKQYEPLSAGCDGQRSRSGAGAEAEAEAEERRGFSNEQLRRLLGVRSQPFEPFTGHVAFQALGASYFVPFGADFARQLSDFVIVLHPTIPKKTYSSTDNTVRRISNVDLAIEPERYSQKTSYRFGFALPFENTLYSAGVERDVQFHLPVDLQLGASFTWRQGGVPHGAFTATLTPLLRRADERLLHYNVVPFVGRQSALQPAPPLVGRHDVVRGRAPPQNVTFLLKWHHLRFTENTPLEWDAINM